MQKRLKLYSLVRTKIEKCSGCFITCHLKKCFINIFGEKFGAYTTQKLV